MQFAFNAADYQPSGSGSICFPLAHYPLRIEKAEFRKVKDSQTKGMLVLHLRTLADVGEIPAGSKHEYRFNLFNDNEQTVRISQQQLSRLCWLIGIPVFTDTDQLVNAQFVALVGPQKDNDKYSEVKDTFDINGREYDPAVHGGKGSTATASAAPVATAPVQTAPFQQPAATAPVQQAPFQQPTQAGFAPPAAAPPTGAPAYAPGYQPAPPPAPGGFNGQVPSQSPWSRPNGNA